MSKNNQGGLDQYGPERFGRLIFTTIRKKGNGKVKATFIMFTARQCATRSNLYQSNKTALMSVPLSLCVRPHTSVLTSQGMHF